MVHLLRPTLPSHPHLRRGERQRAFLHDHVLVNIAFERVTIWLLDDPFLRSSPTIHILGPDAHRHIPPPDGLLRSCSIRLPSVHAYIFLTAPLFFLFLPPPPPPPPPPPQPNPCYRLRDARVRTQFEHCHLVEWVPSA